jgi:hypothetical protein
MLSPMSRCEPSKVGESSGRNSCALAKEAGCKCFSLEKKVDTQLDRRVYWTRNSSFVIAVYSDLERTFSPG